jgi:protein-tyrosine phosphatase
MTRILFVCLGNICRSPTALAVMRQLVRDAGLEDAVELDSAGTGGWHVGSPPDDRAVAAAARRGIVVTGVGRQVTPEDLASFDYVIAMDAANRRELRRIAREAGLADHNVYLLREFDSASVQAGRLDVPDPYSGGPDGFERVLDQIEAACAGLLAELRLRAGRA